MNTQITARGPDTDDYVTKGGIRISGRSHTGFHSLPTADGLRVPVMFALDGSVWVSAKKLPPDLAAKATHQAEPVSDAEWFRLLEAFEERCKARRTPQ